MVPEIGGTLTADLAWQKHAVMGWWEGQAPRYYIGQRP